MAEKFPKTVYGRCPIGHNIEPSSDTGDNLSTNTIDSGEERELVWSSFYQAYVCKTCKRQEEDQADDTRFHEHEKALEQQRQSMGFVKNWNNR